MTRDEQDQAELLDAYWSALTVQPTDAPPSALDPEVAALARRLARDVHIPAPEPLFVDALGRRLMSQEADVTPIPLSARNGHAAVRPQPQPAWRRAVPRRGRLLVALLAATLVLTLLVAALGVYVAATPPRPVSAQEIVRRAATVALTPGSVHSFRLTETTTRYPGNSGLSLFAGYTGTVQSAVARWYEAPNRWRIERRYVVPPHGYLAREYDAPGMQVSDGSVVWTYSAPNNTVQIDKLAGQSGTADLFPLGQGDAAPSPGQTPASLKSILHGATECYTPTLQSDATIAGRATYVVNLERKGCYSTSAHEIDGRLTLWVDKQTFFVLKSVLYDVNDRTRPYVVTEVTGIHYNVPVAASTFTYTPPLGATIVDDRSPTPPGSTPQMGQYETQLKRMAARAGFPLFVPGEALAGLALQLPRFDPQTGLQLIYAPAPSTGSSSTQESVRITDRQATSADATAIPPDATPVLIGVANSPGVVSGWYRPGAHGTNGTNVAGNRISFVRNGAYVTIQSDLLSRDGLVQLAGSLLPVPGGHVLTPNPALRGLAALRPRVPFPIFVPTHVPARLMPEQPALGSGADITINYRVSDGSVALSVFEGATGCCIDQDARKGGQDVALSNGITAHLLGGMSQSGGAILWWEQDGAFVSLSGPNLSSDELIEIAGSMSATASLTPVPVAQPTPTAAPPAAQATPLPVQATATPEQPTPTPATATPTATPTPRPSGLRPAYLPEPMTVTEQIQPAAPEANAGAGILLTFTPKARDWDHSYEGMTLSEMPRTGRDSGSIPDPQASRETIGGREVTVVHRTIRGQGVGCTMFVWAQDNTVLTLANVYNPSGNLRYTCDQLRRVVASVH